MGAPGPRVGHRRDPYEFLERTHSLRPVQQSGHYGGWSVTSHTGDYRDGWFHHTAGTWSEGSGTISRQPQWLYVTPHAALHRRHRGRARFLGATKRVGVPYAPLLRTLAWTGLRLGEALGLQWQDVNFKRAPCGSNGPSSRASTWTRRRVAMGGR